MRANLSLIVSALILAFTTGCSEQAPVKEEAQAEKASAEKGKDETATSTVDEATAASAASCTMEMDVQGMACGVGCPPVVKKALMTVEGVNNVDVSFEKSLATIKASGKACEQGAHEAMIQVLKEKDYTAKLKGDEAEAEKAEKDPT